MIDTPACGGIASTITCKSISFKLFHAIETCTSPVPAPATLRRRPISPLIPLPAPPFPPARRIPLARSPRSACDPLGSPAWRAIRTADGTSLRTSLASMPLSGSTSTQFAISIIPTSATLSDCAGTSARISVVAAASAAAGALLPLIVRLGYSMNHHIHHIHHIHGNHGIHVPQHRRAC